MYRLILGECRGCRGEISTPRSAQPFIIINGRDSQCHDENVDDMANMGLLSVYHPDIEDFLSAKSKDPNRFKHFNLAVLVDDKFMNAVENNENIKLHYPVYDEYGNFVDESQWEESFTKEVSAKELWDKIMKLAYDNGEPGLAFQSTMQKYNPAYYVENIVAMNPCSEYLSGIITKECTNPQDYCGACNLGSLFLHNFVHNPFTKSAYIDYQKLSETIKTAVRILDNVIDINYFPHVKYENYQKNMRTIGLGVTGLADALAMLGIKYNSENARNSVESIMGFVVNEAYKQSVELSKEKGAFNFCDKEKHANSLFCRNVIKPEIRDEIEKYGIRNAKILSIAPCGTISLTYGNNCSSGIEPIFSLSYKRKVRIGGQEDENEQTVEMTDYAYGLYKKMIANGEHVDFAEDDIFETALNIPVDGHIDMLKILAKYVDCSISKTINVPTDYPFEDTKEIYMKCWKSGIKGCTIFRPNEIRKGILITEDSEKKDEASTTEKKKELNCIEPISRKKLGVTHGKTYCKKTACGTLYITVNCNDNNEVVETFVHTSKGGICSANINAINRMISLNLRSGVKVEEVIDQLRGITCPACTKVMTQGTKLDGISCPDIISRTIKEFADSIDEPSKEVTAKVKIKVNVEPEVEIVDTKHEEKVSYDAGVCPECGAKLQAQGGCVICIGDETHVGCGYTKCE